MKNLSILCSLCLLLLAACTSDTNQTDAPAASKASKETNTNIPAAAPTIMPLSIEMDSMVKKGGPCTSIEDCMTVRAVWPILKGGDKKINTIINDSIANFLIQHMGYDPDTTKNDQLAYAADDLIKDFTQMLKEEGISGLGWYQEAIGKIDLSDDIANLEIINYSFMGGAHPNAYVQYTNFDLKTGKIIQYDDLIKDSLAFTKIVQDKFMIGVKERVGDDMVLEDFFWGSGFHLAENFKLEKDSIELLYNPYEAAAYAFGSFPVRIAKKDLKGSIKRQPHIEAFSI